MPICTDIAQAAQTLIEHHGRGAAEHARRHAETLGRSGDLRGQDAALLVLNAVETALAVAVPVDQP